MYRKGHKQLMGRAQSKPGRGWGERMRRGRRENEKEMPVQRFTPLNQIIYVWCRWHSMNGNVSFYITDWIHLQIS